MNYDGITNVLFSAIYVTVDVYLFAPKYDNKRYIFIILFALTLRIQFWNVNLKCVILKEIDTDINNTIVDYTVL